MLSLICSFRQEETAKREINELDIKITQAQNEMKTCNDRSMEIARALEEQNRTKSKVVAEFKKESTILEKVCTLRIIENNRHY